MKKIKFVILSLGAFYFSYSQPKEGQTILNFEVKDSSIFNNVEKGITHLITIRISEKSILWQYSKPYSGVFNAIIYQNTDSCLYFISDEEKKIWKKQKKDFVNSNLKIDSVLLSPILKLKRSYWNRLKTEMNTENYFNARYWVTENEFYSPLPFVRLPELLLIDGKIVGEIIIKSDSQFGTTSSFSILKKVEKVNSQQPIMLPNYLITAYNQAEIDEIFQIKVVNEIMDRIQNGN